MFCPCPVIDTAGSMVVSQAGGVLLTEAARAVGLDRALSATLAPWRAPTAVHDPAKVLLDLAVTLAVGGDCLADIAVLRGGEVPVAAWIRRWTVSRGRTGSKPPTHDAAASWSTPGPRRRALVADGGALRDAWRE